MGHCQGDPNNYDCEAHVAAIIARETGIPLHEVGRRPWPASSMLKKRHVYVDDAEKPFEGASKLGRISSFTEQPNSPNMVEKKNVFFWNFSCVLLHPSFAAIMDNSCCMPSKVSILLSAAGSFAPPHTHPAKINSTLCAQSVCETARTFTCPSTSSRSL